MNVQTIQNSWSDLSGKFKTKWNKFNDKYLEGFKDNLKKVSAQIQKTYGIAKEQTEREFNDFKAILRFAKTSVRVAIKPVMPVVKPQTELTPQSEAMVSEGGNHSTREAV